MLNIRAKLLTNTASYLVPLSCRNLLVPSGVTLVPGFLTIRIFKAEDLPQMDHDGDIVKGLKKRLHLGKAAVAVDQIDPYCVVKFGDYEESTDVVKKNYDPKWYTEIKIPTTVRE